MAAITLRPTGDSRNEKVGLDWWLLGSAALLIIIGLAAIMSSTAGESGTFFKKQILNICLGLVPASIFGFCHPRIWAKMVNFIYIANVIALIAVLAIGDSAKGAERTRAEETTRTGKGGEHPADGDGNGA
jgi:cell division protein FtsW (lipid II flippase)